jgi:hypothetical protein
MARDNKSDLWQELNATDEAFVRQKHACGGYGVAKGRLVGQWIAAKDAERTKRRQAEEDRIARNIAIWTKVGAIATSASVLVAIITVFGK